MSIVSTIKELNVFFNLKLLWCKKSTNTLRHTVTKLTMVSSTVKSWGLSSARSPVLSAKSQCGWSFSFQPRRSHVWCNLSKKTKPRWLNERKWLLTGWIQNSHCRLFADKTGHWFDRYVQKIIPKVLQRWIPQLTEYQCVSRCFYTSYTAANLFADKERLLNLNLKEGYMGKGWLTAFGLSPFEN